MDLQHARRVLHSLFQEVGLVHELQVTEPDQGPEYRVQQRT